MARFNSPLDRLRIAAPCSADWEQMIGTDRVRFCGQCNLNVYNLSSLTKDEAESFIARNEGRLCVRFYRRADGSILTRNCPVGLRAIRKRMSYFAKATASAVLSFFAGLSLYEAVEPRPTMGRMVLKVDQPHVRIGESAILETHDPVLNMGQRVIATLKMSPYRSVSRRKRITHRSSQK